MSAHATRVGVIADDLTGATDLAEQVWRAGAGVAIVVGVPDPHRPMPDEEWIVVALKNRSTPPAEAADEAARAAVALRGGGADVLYQKYCSTFDSTAAGNIGPIGDAIARVVDGEVHSIGTPATPSVGRTVVNGQLLVYGVPLANTSMANHPITPMTDSDLVRLLSPQTARDVRRIDAYQGADRAGWWLADAASEEDLDTLASRIWGEHGSASVIVAHGGAGLAAAMARQRAGGVCHRRPPAPEPGAQLVLSGSLSAATRAQNERFEGAVIRLDPRNDPTAEISRVARALHSRGHAEPVLVTSMPTTGMERGGDAAWTERVLAGIAEVAVRDAGVTRIVVAGGETSGAVIRALGVDRLHLYRSVAPGLVWCTARARGRHVALLLKSGNFGGPDLFNDAWTALT